MRADDRHADERDHSGSSMCPQHVRRRRLPLLAEQPVNASTNTFGLANSATSDATTMIAMPHHSAQCVEDVRAAEERPPSRPAAAISPAEIIHGTMIDEVDHHADDHAGRGAMPMRPPAPNIARSSDGRQRRAARMSTPAILRDRRQALLDQPVVPGVELRAADARRASRPEPLLLDELHVRLARR